MLTVLTQTHRLSYSGVGNALASREPAASLEGGVVDRWSFPTEAEKTLTPAARDEFAGPDRDDSVLNCDCRQA
jgi:hypothetical protein